MPELRAGRRYELVFQDPFTYHEQLNLVGECEVLFEFGKLRQKNIDPYKWMKSHFPGRPWKCYISSNWDTTLIDYTCKPGESKGVWPSWDAEKFDLRELQDYIENPWSLQERGPNTSPILQQKVDQPHKIFVRNLRTGARVVDRRFRKRLTEIQRLYPEVELFIMPGTFNFGLMFGCGFTASSFDPVRFITLNNGTIMLPNGKHVPWLHIDEYDRELSQLGYSAKWIMEERRNAVLYQIDAARYAAHHWNDPTGPFQLSKRQLGDFNNPDMYAESLTYSKSPGFDAEKIKDTDMVLCNACSLWRKCPSYRSEEVCNLPKSETRKLSELAKSRNAGDVVEMLAGVVELQAKRLENRMKDEDTAEDGYDPGIDKMLNNVFRNGTTLAKLRDPNLGRAPLVQINTGLPQQAQIGQAIQSADPRAVASQVVAAIEAKGVPRKDITPTMVQEYIQEHFGAQPELEVVDAEFEETDNG